MNEKRCKGSICLKLTVQADSRVGVENKLSELLLKIFSTHRGDDDVLSVEQAFKELPDEELPDVHIDI